MMANSNKIKNYQELLLNKRDSESFKQYIKQKVHRKTRELQEYEIEQDFLLRQQSVIKPAEEANSAYFESVR